MERAPIVLWQMKPCWGLPNASPFCMKVETWLRMAGLPYQARWLARPPRSASGKVPYLELPDRSLVADSSAIIDRLSREHGVNLDEGLGERERALGLVIQRTFEEDLYFQIVADRWATPSAYRVTRDAYFAHVPWLLRVLVVPVIRRKIVRSLFGQGLLRMPVELRERKARGAIEAMAALLGPQPYFLGARPRTVDATAYAFLANMLTAPIPSAASDAVRAQPNLVAYCQRMKDEFFKGWSPERTTASPPTAAARSSPPRAPSAPPP